MADLQWFPGHMAKTRREMQLSISKVDAVVEVLDARVPLSSRNGYLNEIWSARPRVIVLNKADLADPGVTNAWIRTMESGCVRAIALDSLHLSASSKAAQAVLAALYRACEAKIERDKAKGLTRPIRVMIVGIPNTGKSTLINLLAGRSEAAKTGNKPGVTRNLSWIKVPDKLIGNATGGLKVELLDTPGILWPKFEDQTVARKLAFIGSIGDTALDEYTLACDLSFFLGQNAPAAVTARYGVEDPQSFAIGEELLEAIGRKRGHLKSGGIVDTERTATMLLNEFRAGRVGRISLERPQ